MKVNRKKLDLVMARKCMNIEDIVKSGVSRGTFNNLYRNSNNMQPKTVGKIAKALGCDITEIIDIEE